MLLPTPVAYFSAYFLKTIMSIYGAALLLRTASEETYKKNKNIVYLVLLVWCYAVFSNLWFRICFIAAGADCFYKKYRDKDNKLIPLLFLRLFRQVLRENDAT